MTPNPFTFGNPIRDPARFFGRKEEIRQVVNRLLSSAHESTSIVGERRMGKTSLLKYISHPQVAPNLGLIPERYCLIYIDFQGLTDITPQRFWQRVLAKMARAICSPSLVPEIEALAKNSSLDLFDLEDLCENISNAGLTTVLLLDEFEYVTQNANFSSDFFGGLRALAIHHDLPLITATRRELVDLCHSDEIKGSPFFNIFANVVLRPFSLREAAQMVTAYLAGSDLEIASHDKELIIRLGGGHPFFMQIAGYYLVENKTRGAPVKDLQVKVIADFEQQTDPHFSYLWSHCSESERITLLAALSLERQKPSQKTLVNLENLVRLHPRAALDMPELVKRALLVPTSDREGCYSLLTPSLGAWIGREITAGEGERENSSSVDEWLKSGGKEVLEPVKGALPLFKKKYWPIVCTVLQELSFELAGSITFELLTKVLV